jgi:hypothetical protein
MLASVIFVLGSSGVLPLNEAWSKALSALFAVLGVAFGLGQWLMPLPPLQLTKNTSNNTVISPNATIKDIFPSDNMIRLPKNHKIRKELENRSDIKYGSNGAIIIYTHEDLFRFPITLRTVKYMAWDSRSEIVTAYVERAIIRFHAIYFAVFPSLPEGNYRIDDVPLFFPLLGQNITVYQRRIIEIDGRIGK